MKLLNVNQSLLAPDGATEMKASEGEVLTLGACIQTYAGMVHFMDLKKHELGAYHAAKKIGRGSRNDGVAKLDKEEYDAVKAMADKGTFKQPGGGEEQPVFTQAFVRFQVAELVDAAENEKAE